MLLGYLEVGKILSPHSPRTIVCISISVISSFTYTETFNIYVICIQEVLKRIHGRVPTSKIYVNCPMNNVKGIQKQKRANFVLMDSKMVTSVSALHLSGESRNNVCSVSRKETTKG